MEQGHQSWPGKNLYIIKHTCELLLIPQDPGHYLLIKKQNKTSLDLDHNSKE